MLRLFGAPDAAVGAAVGQFPPQWNAAAQWKSRGAETLVALSAQSAAGLKKAVGALRETFSADLYGAGETTLAEAVVAALEGHDGCSSARMRRRGRCWKPGWKRSPVRKRSLTSGR